MTGLKRTLLNKHSNAFPRRKGMNLQSRINDDDLDFLIDLREETGVPLTLLVAEFVTAGIKQVKLNAELA
jgi:hypothetical protein